MLRLIALLCAGAYVYNMGQNAAATPAEAPAEQQQAAVAQEKPVWSSVAESGGVWLARQVHEQTAWASEGDEARPPVIEVARPAPAIAETGAPRGLRIEFEPSIALAAADFTR